MAISDFKNLIGSYKLGASGYDSPRSRFIDTSPLARHLPITAGTVAFATRAGKSAWDLVDGSCFSEIKAPTPWFTEIIVGFYNTGVETLLPIWMGNCAAATPYPLDDHAALTETWTWSTEDQRSIYVNSATVATTDLSQGAPNANTTFTKNQWNIFTHSFNPELVRTGVQVNLLDPVFTSATDAVGVSFLDHRMRVGYLKESGTITGQFSLGEIHLIADDVHQNQSARLATEVATLKTLYGVA